MFPWAPALAARIDEFVVGTMEDIERDREEGLARQGTIRAAKEAAAVAAAVTAAVATSTSSESGLKAETVVPPVQIPVIEVPPPKPEAIAATEITQDDLAKMTVIELQEVAQKLGMKLPPMPKRTLIDHVTRLQKEVAGQK